MARVQTVLNTAFDELTGLATARFALYIHFPYCLSKCPYCDFASTVVKQVPEERYAHAILKELELRRPVLSKTVHSIYLGGGTPSLWNPKYVAQVLEGVFKAFSIAENAEISLEANPGAADAQRFRGFREAGINRLSMGVQSFQAKTLKALGREHDGPMAETAYEAARQAGFDNVSMDFIFGVHGQTLEEARADAEKAAALSPEHLSAYALTLEKEALAEEVPLAKQLSRGDISLPEDDVVVAMGEAVAEVYDKANLRRYEISNFSKPSLHSRHNCAYWTGGEYLALGVGATGFLKDNDSGVRYTNVRSAEQYLATVEKGQLPTAHQEPLDHQTLYSERLAMGLRLSSGIHLEKLCLQFGQPLEALMQKAQRIEAMGLARFVGPFFQLTEKGVFLHSEVSARLL